jgi:iron complex outermembrane receptor protein
MFDKRVTFNVSAFRMFQDDYQYQRQDPPFNDFVNLGEARTDGVEVELALRLTDWLTLPFTYGYLDARLTKLTNPRAGTVQGQPLFGIPKNTATAGIDIDLPIPSWGTDTSFFLRGDYLMTRNRYLTGAVPLDDYEVIDFKTGMRFAKRYEIYAFGENVTDEVHVITPAAGGRIFSPPGLFGAGFTAKF